MRKKEEERGKWRIILNGFLANWHFDATNLITEIDSNNVEKNRRILEDERKSRLFTTPTLCAKSSLLVKWAIVPFCEVITTLAPRSHFHCSRDNYSVEMKFNQRITFPAFHTSAKSQTIIHNRPETNTLPVKCNWMPNFTSSEVETDSDVDSAYRLFSVYQWHGQVGTN